MHDWILLRPIGLTQEIAACPKIHEDSHSRCAPGCCRNDIICLITRTATDSFLTDCAKGFRMNIHCQHHIRRPSGAPPHALSHSPLPWLNPVIQPSRRLVTNDSISLTSTLKFTLQWVYWLPESDMIMCKPSVSFCARLNKRPYGGGSFTELWGVQWLYFRIHFWIPYHWKILIVQKNITLACLAPISV